jgi:sugar lactone lactonase YvrE
MFNKRDFITAALALAASSAANAQTPARRNGMAPPRKIERGMMKTTRMFKSPPGYANGLAVSPEGLWIAEQKLSGQTANNYGVPEPKDLREAAWLVDWNGKLIKTVHTNSRNCSGMAYGNGCVWMMANQDPFGCFQVDMNGKQISHRQIPLAMPGQNGGGSHGAQWRDGKLWIAALRPKLLIRVDPKTWAPEVAISAVTTPDKPRTHDLTFDANGDIWLVVGSDSSNYKESKPGLVKYDGKTGQLIGTYDFVPGSADPHGLEFHNGTLISCDAGIHPGWPNGDSPHAGWVVKIEPA